MRQSDFPLVSIIIPVYNAQDCLGKCLNSIISQTYQNLEIICVNDGSTDQSLREIEKFSGVDDRITVVDKPNGGVSSARNAGLKRAKGQYIQFVDSDDAITETMTSTLVNTIITDNSDLVICGYQSQEGEVYLSLDRQCLLKDAFHQAFSRLLPTACFNPPWNKLYKKALISDEFLETLPLGEDMVFNLNYMKNCGAVSLIHETPYIYTVDRTGSLSTKYHAKQYEYSKCVVQSILGFLPAEAMAPQKDTLVDLCAKNFLQCAKITIQNSGKGYFGKYKEIKSNAEDSFWREQIFDVYRGKHGLVKCIAHRWYHLVIIWYTFDLLNKIRKIARRWR